MKVKIHIRHGRISLDSYLKKIIGKRQQKYSIVDLVLDKLDTVLPTVLKTKVLDRLVPVKKINEAVLSKSLNHDDGISNEAGVHACSNILFY